VRRRKRLGEEGRKIVGKKKERREMGSSPVGDKTFVTAKKLKMKLKKNGEEVFNFAEEENRAKGNRMEKVRKKSDELYR
jgi:hypothetical protein